jgi:uncharacterized protein (TIGR02594 family)
MYETLKVALNEYGNRAIAGPNSNEEVLKYYHDLNFTWVEDDDVAWCAGFLNWCLKTAGKDYLKSLRARDFLTYGVETKKPQLGDIVVLWRISRDSTWGHCGIFIRETNNAVYLLGGNQNSSVDIQPYPKSQVLAYRSII